MICAPLLKTKNKPLHHKHEKSPHRHGGFFVAPSGSFNYPYLIKIINKLSYIMFSRIFAIVFVTFALTGCIYSRFQTPGTIDSSQKTITVPAGNYGIKGDVKKYLASSGWLIITAQDGEDTASTTTPAKTRYRLVVETETHHDCMNFDWLII